MSQQQPQIIPGEKMRITSPGSFLFPPIDVEVYRPAYKKPKPSREELAEKENMKSQKRGENDE